MNNEEIKLVLEKHNLWLLGEKDGFRANLRDTNLYGAFFS